MTAIVGNGDGEMNMNIGNKRKYATKICIND